MLYSRLSDAEASMRRILVVHTEMVVGGIETSLLNLLEHLVGNDQVTVDLLLLTDAGALLEKVPKGVGISYALSSPLSKRLFRSRSVRHVLERPWRISTLATLVCHIIVRFLRLIGRPWAFVASRRVTYDIALAFSSPGFPLEYVVDQVPAQRKYAWYHRGSYPWGGKQFRSDAQYLSRVDGIVAVSEAVRTELAAKFCELEALLRVIPNFVDIDRVHERASEPLGYPVPETRSLIVTVARLSETKGIDLAIEAARILDKNGIDFTWWVIGAGPDEATLRSLITEYGLNDRFKLLGEILNPMPYVRVADLYVQPSRSEAQGIAIIEALLLGKPILATDIPALRETLKNGSLGALSVPTGEALAEQIGNFVVTGVLEGVLVEKFDGAVTTIAVSFRHLDHLLGLEPLTDDATIVHEL